MPEPVCVPPFHEKLPMMFNVFDPVSVPLLWMKSPTVASTVSSVMVALLLSIATSLVPGSPSGDQFCGLNQLVLVLPPASHV